tara:strand:+ start:26 stop:754 length:729 start_codon:yes stop_codon:yes gene_type:complete
MAFNLRSSAVNPLQQVKDPPNKTSSIFSRLLGSHPVIAGGKALLGLAKSQIAKNINPYEYETDRFDDNYNVTGKVNPAERIAKSLFTEEHQEYKGQAGKERKDLLSMMLGVKQPNQSIPVSKYRPSSSKDKNAVYYSSPTTEKTVKEKLKDPEFLKRFKPNKKGTMALSEYVSDVTHGSGQNVLGKYTLNKGSDEKGKYVSYYDKWDVQPWQTSNKVVNNVTDKIQKAVGIKPTELYGRVYY